MVEQKHERYVNPYTDFGFEQAEIARFTPDETRIYEESLKHYRDIRNVVNSAERRGREEGRREGREEGRKDAKYEAAVKMKAKGFASADIAEITGLTTEEIESI